ncbi:hypothetical protein OMAG_000342 [Candidatus Omnitrophus magneticus]|uniref:Uncharacterized protein n=1 Tax=Candidatus Omnitrophus magneticus TaxID=1609969 RepID=A0A0F0CR43_9BACT|nr:hypothetical protein OMAG_000342 [Candidatus Omnitrophus magneticus]
MGYYKGLFFLFILLFITCELFGNSNMKIELNNSQVINSEELMMRIIIQGIKDIETVENILFPTGKTESFQRAIAFGSNLPMSRFPIIGRIIPDMLPDIPFASQKYRDLAGKSQMVSSSLYGAVYAKICVEKGALATFSEVETALNYCGIDFFTGASVAKENLTRLKDLLINTKRIIDPTGKYHYDTTDEYKSLLDNKQDKTNQKEIPLGTKYKDANGTIWTYVGNDQWED